MVRSWRNVGTTEVMGHPPGVVFDADIPDRQAAQLQAGGHLALDGPPRQPSGTRPPRQSAEGAAGDAPSTAAESALIEEEEHGP